MDSRAEVRQRTGRPQPEWDSNQLIHARRQDAGRRHLERDKRNAPRPKDREPGRRYDTLGEHWQPLHRRLNSLERSRAGHLGAPR